MGSGVPFRSPGAPAGGALLPPPPQASASAPPSAVVTPSQPGSKMAATSLEAFFVPYCNVEPPGFAGLAGNNGAVPVAPSLGMATNETPVPLVASGGISALPSMPPARCVRGMGSRLPRVFGPFVSGAAKYDRAFESLYRRLSKQDTANAGRKSVHLPQET